MNEALIDQILTARTPAQIEDAQEAAREYLEQNPQDDEVRSALEQLAMIKMSLV